MPRETDRAFGAFTRYRDQGPRRKQHRVASELAEPIKRVHRWSSDFDWSDRASAWDDHRDEVRRAAELSEIEEMGRRHAQLGAKMTAAAQRALEVREKGDRPIPASTIAQVAKHGVEIERLARGLHTDHTLTDVGAAAEEDQDFERLLEDPRTRSHLVSAASRPAPVEGSTPKDGGET